MKQKQNVINEVYGFFQIDIVHRKIEKKSRFLVELSGYVVEKKQRGVQGADARH